MQKALTPQHPSENDCFATCALLTTSIYREAMKENNNSPERLDKTAAGYGMEISSNKSKIRVNGIKPRPSTNIRMNGKTLDETNQFKS